MVDSAKVCIVCELEAQPQVCHQHTQTALSTWIRTQPFVKQRSCGLRHPSPQSLIANKTLLTANNQAPRQRLVFALRALNQAPIATEAVLRTEEILQFSCVVKIHTEKGIGHLNSLPVSPRGLRAGRASSS